MNRGYIPQDDYALLTQLEEQLPARKGKLKLRKSAGAAREAMVTPPIEADSKTADGAGHATEYYLQLDERRRSLAEDEREECNSLRGAGPCAFRVCALASCPTLRVC